MFSQKSREREVGLVFFFVFPFLLVESAFGPFRQRPSKLTSAAVAAAAADSHASIHVSLWGHSLSSSSQSPAVWRRWRCPAKIYTTSAKSVTCLLFSSYAIIIASKTFFVCLQMLQRWWQHLREKERERESRRCECASKVQNKILLCPSSSSQRMWWPTAAAAVVQNVSGSVISIDRHAHYCCCCCWSSPVLPCLVSVLSACVYQMPNNRKREK